MIKKDWHNEAIKLKAMGYSSRKIGKLLNKGKSTINDFFSSLKKSTQSNDNDSPKILVLDIETKYLVMQGWGLFNQNFSLDQIQEDWSIISYSAKWYGKDDVIYSDITDRTEEDLIAELYDLFNEADFIIAHNGRRFDFKKIRTRMLCLGYAPHSPVRVIDTLDVAKSEFAFTSNKLMYLTNLLCKKHVKSSHAEFAGHKLWSEFMKGNAAAAREMREYNIIDVLSLEELYEIFARWSNKLPNFEVYKKEPSLGDWIEDGFVYTNLGKYTRYVNIHTGAWRRGRTNLLTKDQRMSLLSNIV